MDCNQFEVMKIFVRLLYICTPTSKYIDMSV